MARPNLKRFFTFKPFRDALIEELDSLHSAIGSGGSDGIVSEPYLGAVSNLGRACDSVSANTQGMSMTTRVAQQDFDHPHILHKGFRSTSSDTSEMPAGGDTTNIDWIEKIGQQIHGGASVVVPNGGIAVNDLGKMPFTIKRGERFRQWTWRSGAPLVYTNGRGAGRLGAGMVTGSGAPTSPQLGAILNPGLAWTACYWPTVLAMTNRRSVLFIDDSHGMGHPERGEPDMYGFYGHLERYFRDHCAWSNMSTNGLSLQSFLANHTSRVAMGQYFSDIFLGCGGNDATLGWSASQMLNALVATMDLYPGKGILSSTEFPKTSSTDGWTTTDFQTPNAADTASRAFSEAKWWNLLPGGRRLDRCYDFAAGVSFFKTNGQIVNIPGYPVDASNHYNAAGYAAAAASVPASPLFY